MDFLKIAKNAALKAGEIQLRNINNIKSISYKNTKGKNNVLTDVDTECEEVILSIIKNSFPAHDVLAEESGKNLDNKSDYIWLIDPLDGTMNYSHSYPYFSVSIALEYRGQVICGVVYDPVKDEMFSSAKNKGAELNESSIKVSNISLLEDSLVVSGTFHHPEEEFMDKFIEILKNLSNKAQGVRRDGSAALDLCYVACGRYESFWEYGLNSWDMAAGALILEEAGGKVTDLKGENFEHYRGELVASNSLIHAEMMDLLKEYF
jgi:myo-inositol-1(or 4)-monophosphatase